MSSGFSLWKWASTAARLRATICSGLRAVEVTGAPSDLVVGITVRAICDISKTLSELGVVWPGSHGRRQAVLIYLRPVCAELHVGAPCGAGLSCLIAYQRKSETPASLFRGPWAPAAGVTGCVSGAAETRWTRGALPPGRHVIVKPGVD